VRRKAIGPEMVASCPMYLETGFFVTNVTKKQDLVKIFKIFLKNVLTRFIKYDKIL